jgi:hypothetical protein
MTIKKVKVIVNAVAFWTCNGEMFLKWIMVMIVTVCTVTVKMLNLFVCGSVTKFSWEQNDISL